MAAASPARTRARQRLAALGLLLVTAAAIAGAAWLAQRYVAQVKSEALWSWRTRLESAVEGRVSGMVSWADARLREARLVANYPALRGLLEGGQRATPASLGHVRELLAAVVRFQPFRATYLLDAEGRVVASAGQGLASPESLAAGVRHLAARRDAADTGRIDAEGRWSGDLVTLPSARNEALVLFTSWIPTAPGERPLGAVAFEEDAGWFLHPHLDREVVASRTGRIVLLVPRRDSVTAIDSRAGLAAPARQGRPPVSTPLAELVARPSGFWEDVDDRGEAVLAQRGPVTGTTWVLLATVTRDEALSAAIRQAWQGIAMVTVVLLASLAAAFALWRNRQAAYMRERLQLEDRLRQSHKMEAIGRLAGGVAHDFNNLLTVISGYAELARDTPDAARRQATLDEIVKAAERAGALTRQLLAFGRRQVMQPRVLDLNEVVRDIETLLRRLIGEPIALVARLAPGPLKTIADRGQLEQVLVNLAVNARDAMPAGGTLEVTTEAVELLEPRRFWGDPLPEGLEPGRFVRVTVRDTGTGIPAEAQAHVFEPFFTTKGEGKGTGLGLATVYGIVRQSGGSITVESRPGDGATFRVFLPAAEGEVERQGTWVERTPATRGGGGVVLVVEDSDAVRGLARQALELEGYRVLEAAAGETALDLLAGGGHVDLLLADVVLPGMNGTELGRRAVERRPSLRVLYMSGHPAEAMGALDLSAVAFLGKPFTPAQLASRVRQVLDGTGASSPTA